MYSTPEFRDIDGTILQYGDVVVITVAGLPIGKLVKGEVVDLGIDYVQIYALGTKESWFVYKPEQILYLYSEGDWICMINKS